MRRLSLLLTVASAALVTPGAVPAGAAPAATVPAAWETVPLPGVSGDVSLISYEDVAVVAPNATFLVGYTRHQLPGVSEVRTYVERWDGTSWTRLDTPDHETAPAENFLLGISGTAANDVWAVGSDYGGSGPTTAFALHHDGTDWDRVDLPRPIAGASTNAADVATPNREQTWVVGSTSILPYRAAVWHRVRDRWTTTAITRVEGCRVGNGITLDDLAVTPAGEVYASGRCPTARGDSAFVLRLRGTQSFDVVTVVAGETEILDLDAGPDGTVYAVGYTETRDQQFRSFVLALAGGAVTSLPRPPGLGDDGGVSAIAVTRAGVVVSGAGPQLPQGRDGYVATWAGGTWTRQPVTGSRGLNFTAVDGSPDLVATWAIGRNGGDPGQAARPVRGN